MKRCDLQYLAGYLMMLCGDVALPTFRGLGYSSAAARITTY